MWLVIGTRPEAIKLAPLANALKMRGMGPRLVISGQHRDLEPGAFGLDGFEAIRLHCPGSADPYDHARAVEFALRLHLRERPDLLVVQGDTSTAFGAAKAGFVDGIPVAHVEAGLRTYDPQLPWPEEEFRTAIDARAALLFAPTETSAANLQREGLPGAIHVTGNTGIDALLALTAAMPSQRRSKRARPSLLVTCHRRESWGAPLLGIGEAIADIAGDGLAEVHWVLHPNPRVAEPLRQILTGRPNVQLREPMGHSDLIAAMRDSDLVLSDSGGVQEEAPALGVPVLVLREKTERPEAIASGNARLIGTSSNRIAAEVRDLLADRRSLAAMARPAFPFGDGRSAPRIAALIEDWLDRPRRR